VPIRRGFSEGFRAAKANLFPGLLLQALMVIFFSLYIAHDGTRRVLEHVAETKQEAGLAFAFFGYILSAAILPELLKIAFFQELKPTRQNFRNVWIGVPWWGFIGMIVDLFYRLQSLIFGVGHDVLTIFLKMVVDQFLFSPFFGNPLAVMYFAWAEGGFRKSAVKAVLPELPARVFGIQCAGWMIWIPGVCLIYAMPPLLQIPVAILINTFWVLIFTTVRERQSR
jgi:hypothetical protein